MAVCHMPPTHTGKVFIKARRGWGLPVAYCDRHAASQLRNLPDTLALELERKK